MSDPRLSIIPAGAVFDTRLSATDLRVLAVLGTHTDKRGWCFPKQKAVAERIGVARTTVTAAIKKLVECGWVKKKPRFRAGGGKTTCLYQVALDTPFEGDCDVMSDDIAMSEEATSQCQPERPTMSAQGDINERTHLNETLPLAEVGKVSETKQQRIRATTISRYADYAPEFQAIAAKHGLLNGNGERVFRKFAGWFGDREIKHTDWLLQFDTWCANERAPEQRETHDERTDRRGDTKLAAANDRARVARRSKALGSSGGGGGIVGAALRRKAKRAAQHAEQATSDESICVEYAVVA